MTLMKMTSLTVGAVLAAPALLADFAALLVTAEVPQLVVPGAAVGGARLAVVELVAHHVVGVAQLAVVGGVHVLRPRLAHGQLAAGGQAADQVALVLWGDKGATVGAGACSDRHHDAETAPAGAYLRCCRPLSARLRGCRAVLHLWTLGLLTLPSRLQ